MKEKIDLSGMQCVENGLTKHGDIVIFEGRAMNVQQTGVNVQLLAETGARIYRKIPVASNSIPTINEIESLSHFKDVVQKAATDDEGKPPLANLPWAGIREVSMVQAYGHSKYKDFNNYRKGMEVSRNLSCAIRHISDFMDGKDLDDESNRNHLAHAACRLLFVLQNIHDKTAIDDRYTKLKK